MSILILDNYDSFTFNLSHMLEKLTTEKVSVFRNDEISIEQIDQFDRIVISPGPGLPKDAGIVPEAILQFHKSKKILGVCLGHQAIAEVLGGSLFNLSKVLHGQSTIGKVVADDPLFNSLPDQFEIGHYHSWVVAEPLPPGFIATMRGSDGLVMAMRHQTLALHGVQFHPESVLTPFGDRILHNWLRT